MKQSNNFISIHDTAVGFLSVCLSIMPIFHFNYSTGISHMIFLRVAAQWF